MSWHDFYRRRDALNAVLEHARRNPASPLPYAEVPEAAEVFGRPTELLLALHHKWIMLLTGRLGVALAEAERDPQADTVEAVAAAWRDTAAEHPVLRGLLDRNEAEHGEHGEHGGMMRAAIEGEQRLLALSAGLAEPPEGTAEITAVGAAFRALIRNTPERPPRRRGPVEQLLRHLIPSA